ncbi:uroporphyrinogen-III C-methyltransferase [Thiomonas sp. FB-6]|uniref:uroporphyrinogen-III C-methyltransferase n=1 Tax=Thiomonas sp. FB-6 TaxID=1158291 RepID=UPI0009DC4213|nr:uroporphyrinogen-III C-methyltransferase [Thiomonas sp. FB-6]
MNPGPGTKPGAKPRPRVLLVGAGPGDPELLTVKAVRAIRQATVILVDDLVAPACLRLARRACRIVQVGKRGGCASTPQDFIQRLMVVEALRGERVVRLKGGDPSVFGRAGEELACLRAAGIEVDIVPGITAGLAAAAAAGASLTHREHSHGVALVAGHTAADSPVDWASLVRSRMTLVVYMGVSAAASIRRELLAAGLEPGTPVLLMHAVASASQRRVDSSLGRLEADLRAAGLASPCVMLIGRALGADAQGLAASPSRPASSPSLQENASCRPLRFAAVPAGPCSAPPSDSSSASAPSRCSAPRRRVSSS